MEKMKMAKYLLNSEFKAIRKGDFVSADEESGEFILDTTVEKMGMSKGQLEEVAAANKLKVSAKLSAVDYSEELANQLENLKIAEVNKMTNTDIVKKIVEEGFEAGKTDEEMLVEVIQAGIKFKEAGKLFNQVAEEGGYRVNAKKRKEQVNEMLDEAEFAPEHWDEVVSMADHIQAEIAGTEEKTALGLIRSWCKTNEVTLPKKTKTKKPKFAEGVMEFMAKRAGSVTVEDVVEHISEQKPEFEEEKVAKMAARFFKYVEFARGCAFEETDEAEAA